MKADDVVKERYVSAEALIKRAEETEDASLADIRVHKLSTREKADIRNQGVKDRATLLRLYAGHQDASEPEPAG